MPAAALEDYADNINFLIEDADDNVKHDKLGIGKTGQLVDGMYGQAPLWQWLLELWRNSVESGATIIEFGPCLTEFLARGSVGGWKGMWADNGGGMPPREMRKVIGNLSESGRLMGTHANFGIGVKVSTLSWNHLGVLFMSWVGGKGYMMKLIRKGDDYVVFRWPGKTGNPEIVEAPPDYKPSWMGDHGTVVILLGNEDDEDTLTGPALPGGDDAEPDKPGFFSAQYVLNTQLFEIPDEVTLRVRPLNPKKKSEWPKTRGELPHTRAVYGARYYLDRLVKETSGQSGTVDIPGAKVHWWYHPPKDGKAKKSPGDESYHASSGYITAMYRNEMYDALRRGHRGGKRLGKALSARYHSFGLSWPAVTEAVTLIVEPDRYDKKTGRGVKVDMARGRLHWGNGGELPWAEWGVEFCKQIPEVINTALKEQMSDGHASDRWKAWLLDYVKELLLNEKKVADTSSNPPRSRKRVVNRDKDDKDDKDDDDDKKKKKKKKKKSEITSEESHKRHDVTELVERLKIEWTSETTLSSGGFDDGSRFDGKAASFNGANLLLVNEEFSVFRRYEEKFCAVYADKPDYQRQVRAAMQDAVNYVFGTRIISLNMFRGDWVPESWLRAISNEALTVSILGPEVGMEIKKLLANRIGGSRADKT